MSRASNPAPTASCVSSIDGLSTDQDSNVQDNNEQHSSHQAYNDEDDDDTSLSFIIVIINYDAEKSIITTDASSYDWVKINHSYTVSCAVSTQRCACTSDHGGHDDRTGVQQAPRLCTTLLCLHPRMMAISLAKLSMSVDAPDSSALIRYLTATRCASSNVHLKT